METRFFYYGSNDFLINSKIEEHITSTGIDAFNVMRYDLLENTSEDILEDLQTVSFFSEKKVVVVKNAQALSKVDELTAAKWIGYLEKPNPDAILLMTDSDIVDKTSAVGDAIFKYVAIEKVEELKKEDYPSYVVNMVKKYQYTITQDALKSLLERTNYDFDLISQELDKLMLFCYDQKEINEKAVHLLVSRNLEENIYELTQALIERNQNKAIDIFYDLMARNEDPLRILNNIIGRVRELIHTKLLVDKGYTQDKVMSHFGISSGRAYYVIKQVKQITYPILEDYLKRLSQLDYEIKSGKTDKKIGLELFLLGA